MLRELNNVELELFKAVLSLIGLAVGWLIGQRIIVSWDLRKKRLELDIAAAERFQRLYGDLKEVSRLWRSILKPEDPSTTRPDHLQWTLLEKATRAESDYEAIVIKLATERRLSDEQVRILGLFRQASQQVRQSIAKGQLVPSSGFSAEYLLFNELAVDVTRMIGSTKQSDVINGATARENLKRIALIRSNDWDLAVGNYSAAELQQELSKAAT